MNSRLLYVRMRSFIHALVLGVVSPFGGSGYEFVSVLLKGRRKKKEVKKKTKEKFKVIERFFIGRIRT